MPLPSVQSCSGRCRWIAGMLMHGALQFTFVSTSFCRAAPVVHLYGLKHGPCTAGAVHSPSNRHSGCSLVHWCSVAVCTARRQISQRASFDKRMGACLRYLPEVPPIKMAAYVRFGAWLAGVDMFDASAFRLPRAEAATLDPQHRLLLESTATALQDGGIVSSAQTTGAF